MSRYCTFCAIIDRREPAAIRYEDDDVLVFDNILGWTRVMMLAVPKQHRSQTELWADLGLVGRVAAEVGRQYAPQGFRLLSNFGASGMQSQPHGHLHILDGTEPQLEVRATPRRSIVDLVCCPEREVARTPHAVFYDARPVIPEAPITHLAVPAENGLSQADLWRDIRTLGADVVAAGWSLCPNGFRLLSNFPGEAILPGGEKGHVHLLGGTFLGHYA